MAWPLYVVFVVMFAASMVGLVGPALWSDQPVPALVFWILLGISIVLAVVAYFPRLAEWFRSADLGRRLDAINHRLDTAGVRGHLEGMAHEASIADDIRTQLDELATRLAAGGDIGSQLAGIAAQRDDVAAVRKQLDGIRDDITRLTEAVAKLAAPAIDAHNGNAPQHVAAETESEGAKLQQ